MLTKTLDIEKNSFYILTQHVTLPVVSPFRKDQKKISSYLFS